MSSILAIAGSETNATIIITIGVNGAIVGYSTDSVAGVCGTLSGSTGSFSGKTLNRILSDPGTFDFQLQTNTAGVSQSLFKKVSVANSSGTYVTFLSSAASYFSGGGATLWTWGSGASPVWTSSDSGKVRSTIIFTP